MGVIAADWAPSRRKHHPGGPPGRPGRSGRDGSVIDSEKLARAIETAAAIAVRGLPRSKDGEPGRVDSAAIAAFIEARLAQEVAKLPRPAPSPPPVIRAIKGDTGPSLFEVWLSAGHEGNEDDFFDWLVAEILGAIKEEIIPKLTPDIRIMRGGGGIGPKGDKGDPGDGGSGATYSRDFTQADLTAGILDVDHDLGGHLTAFEIYDDTGEAILPDNATHVDDNHIAIDLSSLTPISGTWTFKGAAT